MDIPIIDDTENFVSFCKKANLPITELPTKDKPMGMTYEIAMKEYDPYLYQRLTIQKPLRADVAVRHKTGNYWIEDVKELEEKGYTGVAENLRKQIEEGQRLIQENKLKEMTARNEAVAKKHAERQKGMQYMPPLSPTAIARAREQWGISGE